MNENENKKMLFVAFCARFVLGGLFPFAARCFLLLFVAFCYSSLLVLVPEIESVLSQEPKTGRCL